MVQFVKVLSDNPQRAKYVRDLRLDSWAQPRRNALLHLPDYRTTAERLIRAATDVKHVSMCLLDKSFEGLEDFRALCRTLYELHLPTPDRTGSNRLGPDYPGPTTDPNVLHGLQHSNKANKLFEQLQPDSERFATVQPDQPQRSVPENTRTKLQSLDIKFGYCYICTYSAIREIIACAFDIAGLK